MIVSLLAACSNNVTQGGVQLLSSYPEKPASLRVNLTDAPKQDFSEVHVNIKHVELWLSGKGKEARLIIAEGLGDVDLLTLRNGVLLPMSDISMPEGVSINKIRLILEEAGHYGLKTDGSTCDLDTPSATKTGIKINLKQPVTFENNYAYSLTIDFDAGKSVVSQGNGDCLLKPVLKIPSFTRTPAENTSEEGGPSNDPAQEEEVTDGTDDNFDDGLIDGFDPSDPSTWPEDITEEELAKYF